MSDYVNYRYNVMGINSLEAFMGVRGGFNNSLRDVYFVRALGTDAAMLDVISKIDEKAGKDSYDGKMEYLRLGKLPRLVADDDIKYYSGMYDKWKNNSQVISLKSMEMGEELGEAVSCALKRLDKIFRDGKVDISDSIIRNLSTKVLFWLDGISKEILCNWNARRSIKIIAENIVKEQEYLFFYFLTQIGCDVVLLEMSGDVNTTDAMKNLSQTFEIGAFGQAQIPEYKKYTPQNKETVMVREVETYGKPVTVTIPGHNRPREHTQAISDTQKSFEELAQLASSIVMIAVHDRGGEVMGTGSGIMIGRDGYILTNCHVVSGGSFFSVRIEDDDEVYTTDEVIKYNSNLDMAIIRIHKKLNPLPIYRGKQKLVRGQKVVAIGSPLGLFNSVSDGIISGFRTIRNENMIQFTAPISPGSSGGAVLNMQGEVIGISTAGIDSGQNINLAMGYENILMFAKGFYF